MAEKFRIDDTDRKIIAELRRNGRASNQEIANRLGIGAVTVAARIRRLEEADKLRVVAVSDFRVHGYDVLLQVAVEVAGRAAAEVAADLAKLDEVFAVQLVSGRHDINILVVLKDFSELQDLLFNKLSVIPGIRSMVPAITVDVVKYNFDIAPIT